MKSSFVKIEYDKKDYIKYNNEPFQIIKEKKNNKFLCNKIGHWDDKQNVKYYAFLKCFHQKFQDKQMRRQWKVFKTLSEFIKTRNPNQCRSHHHKMQKDFCSIEQTLQSIRKKIPDIEKKAKKYQEVLNKITFFSVTNMSQYKPTEIQIHQNKKINQKPQNIQYPVVKKQCLSNMHTGLSYEDPEEKNKFSSLQYYFQKINTCNKYNKSLKIDTNQHYKIANNFIKSKQEQFNECHYYFLRWWTKLTSLIYQQQLRKNYPNTF